MPVYSYKAKVGPNAVRTGTIEAETEKAAINKLLLLNYHPIYITPKSEEQISKYRFLKKVKPKDIYIFLRQLSNLNLAGLPLVKALNNIYLQSTNPKLKSIIFDLREKIQKGKTLSEALSFHLNVFTGLEINMIKSAEASGTLGEVIVKIADLKEKDINFTYRIRSALAYPILLMSVGILTLFILTTFVLPKFVTLFQDLGQQLPLATQVLISVSVFFKNYWVLMLTVIAIICFFLIKFLKTDKGKLQYDTFKLSIPILKNIVIKVQTARFARMFASLIENGVPIINSLQIVSEIVTNKVFSVEIKHMHALVAKGQHISEALKGSKIFEKNTLDLIAVGEESGQLDKMLFRIADMNESESTQQIETLMFMFEPALILTLGFIIGLIVLAILLPIFQMNFLIQ